MSTPGIRSEAGTRPLCCEEEATFPTGGREDLPGPTSREEPCPGLGEPGGSQVQASTAGAAPTGSTQSRAHSPARACPEVGSPCPQVFQGLPKILFLSEVHRGKDSVSDLKPSLSPQSACLSHLHFCRMKVYLKTVFDVILPQPFLGNKESEHFLRKKTA